MSPKLFIILICFIVVCSSTNLQNHRKKRQNIGPKKESKSSKKELKPDEVVLVVDNSNKPKQLDSLKNIENKVDIGDHTGEHQSTLKGNDEHNKITNTGDHNQEKNDLNDGLKVSNDTKKVVHPSHLDFDAATMKRGLLVFVGIGLIFIIYLGIKMYRSNRSSNKNVMVKKYGVRTRRSDLEMTLLPLEEEDEEDETVFDVLNIKTNTT